MNLLVFIWFMFDSKEMTLSIQFFSSNVWLICRKNRIELEAKMHLIVNLPIQMCWIAISCFSQLQIFWSTLKQICMFIRDFNIKVEFASKNSNWYILKMNLTRRQYCSLIADSRDCAILSGSIFGRNLIKSRKILYVSPTERKTTRKWWCLVWISLLLTNTIQFVRICIQPDSLYPWNNA